MKAPDRPFTPGKAGEGPERLKKPGESPGKGRLSPEPEGREALKGAGPPFGGAQKSLVRSKSAYWKVAKRIFFRLGNYLDGTPGGNGLDGF